MFPLPGLRRLSRSGEFSADNEINVANAAASKHQANRRLLQPAAAYLPGLRCWHPLARTESVMHLLMAISQDCLILDPRKIAAALFRRHHPAHFKKVIEHFFLAF